MKTAIELLKVARAVIDNYCVCSSCELSLLQWIEAYDEFIKEQPTVTPLPMLMD